MYINSVVIGGNSVSAPEIFSTKEGSQCAVISVALNKPRANGGQTAMFMKVRAWGGTSEFCRKYVSKGTPLVIEGELYVDEYTKKDGTRGREFYVLARSVQSATPRPRGEAPVIDDSDVPEF